MKVTGIISEYNPFHNGHKHQINIAKATGSTHIVSVMSGNYVQRGDFAIFDKYKRAKQAVKCGVDLVIELPVQFSLSPAEIFSRASVLILDSIGCVDFLCFGAETDDLKLFEDMLFLQSKEYNIKKYLDLGQSYPKARLNALKDLNKALKIINEDDIELFLKPNNILAIEYLKAIKQLKSSIKPLIIKRHKANHDDENIFADVASASKIRELMYSLDDWKSLVPKNTLKSYEKYILEDNYCDKNKIDMAVMSYLKRFNKFNKNDLSDFFDISEGLDNRIICAIEASNNLEELYNNIKSKRYTMARIRRIVLNLFLNITKKDLNLDLSYIKVLAFNKNGTEILKKIKKETSLIIVHSQKELEKISQRQSSLEKLASSLYGFIQKNPYKSNWEYIEKISLI